MKNIISLGYGVCIALMVLVVFPVVAQKSSNPETCKGAQAWYDQLDTASLSQYAYKAMSSTITAKERNAALGSISDFGMSLYDNKLPECLKQPVEWYQDSLRDLTAASVAVSFSNIMDNWFDTYNTALIRHQRRIGQVRGYLTALGVSVKDFDYDTVIVLK